MIKKRRLLITVLIFILLLYIVNSKEDFSFDAEKTISLCQCSAQRYYIAIKNTGDATSTYSVKTKDKIDWLSPYPSQFVLKPGQKTRVPVNVNLPCYNSSQINTSIIIFTDNGIAKSLKQSYIIKSCYDYEIHLGAQIEDKASELKFNVYKGEYNLCEGETRFIPLFFNNKAEFSNSYNVFVKGKDWTNLNVNKFDLGKMQTGAILLELSPPQNSEGKHEFAVLSAPQFGNLSKKIAIGINVEKCHSIDLILPEKDNLGLCSGDEKDYVLAVKNNGKKSEDVMLKSTGAEWARIPQNVASIAPMETALFKLLVVVPDIGTSGTFDIGIEAHSRAINKSNKLSFEIIPRASCYEGSVYMNKDIEAGYSESYIPVKIKNSGIRAALYELSVDGPGWVSVEPKTVTLEPKKSWNLNIKIEPSADIKEGDYSATLKLKFEDTVYSKNFNIILKKKKFSTKLKNFYLYYKYYIYLFLILLAIVIILLLRIPRKLKIRYKNYRIRRKRLRALEKAREARRLKKKEK